jgi:hypothetical protein
MKSTVSDMLRECLDLEVQITKKSNGSVVTDSASFWAGLIGGLVTFPLYLLLVWLFGTK